MTLRRSILLLITSLLVGTVTLIGGVAYFTTKQSVAELVDRLLREKDSAVQQKMTNFFQQIEVPLALMEEEIFADVTKADELGWEKRAGSLVRLLELHPDLSWLHFTEADTGNLLGATRLSDSAVAVVLTLEKNNRIPQTFILSSDGQSLVPSSEIPGLPNPPQFYDARTRPWFQAATKSSHLVWTDPYRFENSLDVGITASVPIRDKNRELVKILSVDLVMKDVGAFLDSIQVGESGAAFLLSPDGQFLADIESRKLPGIKTLRDALLSAGFSQHHTPQPAEIRRFVHKGVRYAAHTAPISFSESGFRISSIIVPERDFLAPVWRNALLTIAIGLLVLGLAISLGVWFSRHITEPLASITGELENIGQLNFHDDPDESGGVVLKSSIREIALFKDSLGKMKVSLRSFARYVPRDLVLSLLSRGDEAKLGGRIEQITVQFADLAGFTRLSENMPADEAFAELRLFLEIIAHHQQAHGGVTSSFTGDGTLALFNAPERREGHEIGAIEAAIDALTELDHLNKTRAAEGKPALNARFGINTADVLLGNLGTRDRFAYTAVGDGVNLASRFEGLNKLYHTRILVGQRTRQIATNRFVWRKVDRIAVQGRKEPVEIFEPIGRKSESTSADTSWVSDYHHALEQYFAGEFQAALRGFRQVLIKHPNDGPSRAMCDRIEKLLDSRSHVEKWTGVFEAPFK